MDHVEFDFFDDFTTPLIAFLKKCNINFNENGRGVKLPLNLFELPQNFGEPI